jgi:hypothetical protein
VTLSLPRPPRDPDFRNPQDVARWTRDLREYLNQVAAKVAEAALELADAQPLSPTLTALDGLSATAGLLEQTGADTFAKRAIGVAAASSIPTRAHADARYALASEVEDYVTGPASATDNAVVRYDATTGKLVQDSGVTIDDNGVLAGHRIGAWTSNADAAVNGYVTVTDNSGNSRKLATIA